MAGDYAANNGEVAQVKRKREESSTPVVNDVGACSTAWVDKEGYGEGPEYWEKRYKEDPKPFEWLEGFEELEALIKEAANGNQDANFLNVGCGNSLLPEGMYDHGYKSITSIDNAGTCILQMAARNKVMRPELKWLKMDATKMQFEKGIFDAVIDKSVIDTFACGDNASLVICAYLAECWRVLRPKGVFLCISYGNPETRLAFFRQKNLEFSVRHVALPVRSAGSAHYAYVLTRID
mmetsp:Transcript_74726/g.120652  ORF Transcript_74726/g.120652 Transcript_74726/m.120652 type:complete len:236 (-) Transcript_74726:148-855(-)